MLGGFVLLLSLPILLGGDTRFNVYFPPGLCTAKIELQKQQPDKSWTPHPRFPLVEPKDCIFVDIHEAVNWRIRCVDPTGIDPPSPWQYGISTLKDTGFTGCNNILK